MIDKNSVRLDYVRQENSSIFFSYVLGLSFVSLTAYKGCKMNNTIWINMAVKLMSIHFYGKVYLAYVLFCDCRDQAIFEVKYSYVWW